VFEQHGKGVGGEAGGLEGYEADANREGGGFWEGEEGAGFLELGVEGGDLWGGGGEVEAAADET